MEAECRGMGLANKHSQTTRSTSENSLITELKAKADWSMRMVMCTKDNGRITKLMGLECICIVGAQSMRAFGRTICRTDKVYKSGMMAAGMRGSTKMVRSTGRAPMFGPMGAIMWVHGARIIFTGQGSITGRTADPTLVSGARTKCMGKVRTLGKMVESIREDIRMIKSMGMGNTFGPMGESFKGNGSTGKEAGKES